MRIVLGTQLRRLREAKGISREAAGEYIRASHAKICRMELGRVALKERDVVDLLRLYEADGDMRAEFVDLVRQANKPGWWQRHNDLLPSWFETYLRLEQSATVIRTYQLQFVPGLLQCEEYARSVIGVAPAVSAVDLERRVRLRLARQQMLVEPGAPTLWAVVDEAALTRPVGPASVMRTQLEHLVEMSARPNVTVQMLPFAAGGHAAAGGSFSILRFGEPDLPDIVYLEQLTSSVYLDKPSEVELYRLVMDQLVTHAMTPDRTTELLHRKLHAR
jgi:transcriptional regulator with XRE-family HTH domain